MPSLPILASLPMSARAKRPYRVPTSSAENR